jgi:hypothetical protein
MAEDVAGPLVVQGVVAFDRRGEFGFTAEGVIEDIHVGSEEVAPVEVLGVLEGGIEKLDLVEIEGERPRRDLVLNRDGGGIAWTSLGTSGGLIEGAKGGHEEATG